MRCPSCGHENRETAKFCEECAAPLKQVCPNCGKELRPSAKFCDECATPVSSPAKAAAGDEEAVTPHGTGDAERRQLTVMFCDLVGSTALSERLDPEDLREVLRAYHETCAELIARFDGHIAKYLGDGVLVYFGHPQAHDDDPVRGASAALGIIAEMPRLNARVQGCAPQMRDHPLEVRIGLHTGLVVIGEIGAGSVREKQAVVGETPNVAARLVDVAEPNTVVISEATRRLVQGVFVLEELGAKRLKGVAEPLRVHRVLQASGMQSRLDLAGATGLTPFVGREQEVALLLDRWEQVNEGHGQVVLLGGEAGMGKSRLVQVLRERLAEERHGWLECRSSAYHQNSALYPVIELLEQALLFSREDSAEEKAAKLEITVRQAGFPLAEIMPLFAPLLSLPLPEHFSPLPLSPEVQRRKTLEWLAGWLFSLSRQQPMVLVAEDLHWIDPSSLELLGMMIEQAPTAGVLLLCTFRPGFESPWASHSHMVQWTLPRLTRRQVRRMVEGITGGKALPAAVLEEVAAKTDGVPLFVEELTKMVLESGLLVEREQQYELAGPLPPLAIPTTLQDSLMARLDRLGPTKEVVQLGAVLGREFSQEMLEAVSSLDERTLEEAVARLVRAELLYQRGVRPLVTYTFKHALIQETAYQSLLKSVRQLHHARIATVLETRFPQQVESAPQVLAHHYEGAGLLTQAITHYQRAGQNATQRSASAEAIGHLARGIELLSALPETRERNEQELMLHVALGAPLVAAKGYASPEVERVYGRARELCQGIGEAPQLLPALWGLYLFYMTRSELATAYQLGEQLLDLAKRAGKPSSLLIAHGALGVALYWQGCPSRALEHLEQAAAVYDPAEHRSLAYVYGQDFGVGIGCYTAWSLWSLGYPDRALQQSSAMLDLAREGAHPFSLALGLFWSAGLHHMRREPGQAGELAEEVVGMSAEQGFPLWQALGLVLRGWAHTNPSAGDLGLQDIQNGLAQFATTGQEIAAPWALGILGEAWWSCGREEDALGAVEAALALSERTQQPFWDADLHRLKGELLLQKESGVAAEAESCFHRALEDSRTQKARSLELRAAVSLARLWQKQAKTDDARQLLADIYGWFTEGFDTADLKEAKALLDELA